jgi:arginase
VLELLPAAVSADRVALVGLHAWAEDDIGNVAEWGIQSFSPAEFRETTQPLLDWLAATGCSRVAVHFDVDTSTATRSCWGLGAEPDGPTSAQVRRVVDDLDSCADIVGMTVAEFIPRQVMHLQQILADFPLLRHPRLR